MSNAVRDVLRSVFPQLSDEALDILVRVARVVEYPDEHVLCRAGTTGSEFFVLVEGQVQVFKHTESGPRQIDIMGRGQFFGEMSLLRNQPRGADVVADGPVTVIEIDREIFDHHIKTNSELVSAMSQLIIDRLLSQEARMLEQLPNQQPADGPQVFMSYSRADQEFVFRLADDLIEHGIRVWLDQREIGVGMIWSAEIQKALDASDAMIVVLSPSGVESRHAADEWHFFIEEAKPIVPVIIAECRIPYQLRRIQHVNFTTVSYEAALDQLIATLRAITG